MIGSRLRQFRQAHGLTLDELAEASRVSRGTIHRIELDQVSPRLDTLADLCDALGINLSDFFRTPGPAPEASPTVEAVGFQKGAQEWLEHVEALVRYSADSLSVLDREGRPIYESEGASCFHAERLETRRSRPWWTCAHPEEQEALRLTFTEFLEKGESRILVQYRILHQDGSWHWVRTALSHQLEHPLIHGIIANTQDVSLLKRIEEGFHRAQKLESLTTAVGGVAQTFSNLLMVIQAHLELACGEQQVTGHPASGHMKAMQDALQCATQMLNQMRSYAGNPILPLSTLDLNAMIRDLVPSLRRLGRAGHRFQFDLDDTIPVLEADRSLMARLLADLVGNACEALGERAGVVTLRTARMHLTEQELCSSAWAGNNPPLQGDCVVLEVHDTGCGMDSEIASKIFDPFFSTKFMGRGMGLPTVLGTVRTHRGGLRFSSEPGSGSTFQIFLPSTARVSTGKPLEPAAHEAVRCRTILIAEDDPTLRDCIRTMLETMGHPEILEAENGKQALDLYQAHAERIGLVLLDLDMPIMDGIEAFTRLRQLNPSLNILFSTGAWERDPRLATRTSEGTTAILHKPYRLEQLKSALATFD